MVSFKLVLSFFGPLFGFFIGWFLVRHPNSETQRKRGETLLVLAPFVFVALLFIAYLIFQ